MEVNVRSSLINEHILNERIDLLAAVDAVDTPFISCYLDIQSGRNSCFSFIREQTEHIVSKLSGVARLDFEEAIDLVHDALNHDWPSEISGLAIFARGVSGGRFLCVIPFALPFEQRMEFCRVPDIRPLLRFRDEVRPYTLLRARNSDIEIIDISYGSSVNMGRIIANPLDNDRRITETELKVKTSSCSIRHRPADISLQSLRGLLAQKRGRPIVLAGDDEQLDTLRNWFPGWLRSRLGEIVTLPCNLSEHDVQRKVTDHLAARQRDRNRCFAASFVEAYNHDREAVSGTTETIGALHAGVVETLLVTTGPGNPHSFDRFGPANRYIGSLTGYPSFLAPDLSWDPAIELCRIAYQHGVDIVVTDSDEIAKIGGIGGVLRGPVESQVMPLPVVEDGLRRVA